MKQIDALHTEFPFAGARMLRGLTIKYEEVYLWHTRSDPANCRCLCRPFLKVAGTFRV